MNVRIYYKVLRATPFAVAMQRQSTAENCYRIYTPILTLPVILKYIYSWSHFGFAGFHVTSSKELLFLPSFYFHEALEELSKTNTRTNFYFFLRNRALDLRGRMLISEQSLHHKEHYRSNV